MLLEFGLSISLIPKQTVTSMNGPSLPKNTQVLGDFVTDGVSFVSFHQQLTYFLFIVNPYFNRDS